MSITVSISAVQTHAPDVDADEMSNSRRSRSLLPESVGVDNPCCRKPTDLFVAYHSLERSSSRFSVTVTIQSSRSQYFTNTNHLLCGFISTFFLLKACFRSLQSHQSSPDWSMAVMSHVAVNSDARSIQISSQNIRIRC